MRFRNINPLSNKIEKKKKKIDLDQKPNLKKLYFYHDPKTILENGFGKQFEKK